MYLQSLARDLYRSQKEVESLENQLEKVGSGAEQGPVKEQLRLARAELEQIRKILEGKKEQSKASLYKPKRCF